MDQRESVGNFVGVNDEYALKLEFNGCDRDVSYSDQSCD